MAFKLRKSSLLLGGLLATTTAFAGNVAQNTTTAVNQQQLLLSLQKQVQSLKSEVDSLKKSKSNKYFATYKDKVSANNFGSTTNLKVYEGINNPILNTGSLSAVPGQGIDVSSAVPITSKGKVSYLGAYSGNNSVPIGMLSSSLFASSILGQRNNFSDYAVTFGAYIEGDAQAWNGNISSTNADHGQNLYMTSAKLYFLANLGHYVTAQFDIDGDQGGNFGIGDAFVVFGNLDTSPWFVTVGKLKPSVGSYGGGGPWTSGLTSTMFKAGTVSQVSLNYKANNLNWNVAVFGGHNDKRLDFSTGLFYADSITDKLSGGFNIGYIHDLNAVNGSDNNGVLTSAFGDGVTAGQAVGSVNFDGNLAYTLNGGTLQVQTGLATTTTKQNYTNNSNGKESYAGAWYTGTNYSLVLGGRNTNFGIAYSQSYNANGITGGLSPTNGGKLFKYIIKSRVWYS